MSKVSHLEQEMGKHFTLSYFDLNDIWSGLVEEGRSGIYAWYYKPPKEWRSLGSNFFIGAPSVREVAGLERRGGKQVRVKWEYQSSSEDGDFSPLQSPMESNFFRYATLIMSAPIYIGYSENLSERLATHARNIKKLCLAENAAEEDSGEPFTGWLADYIEVAREQGGEVLELRHKDFYVAVLSANAAFSIKSINEIEKELISFIQPLANRK
jgi:hypothetical protein